MYIQIYVNNQFTVNQWPAKHCKGNLSVMLKPSVNTFDIYIPLYTCAYMCRCLNYIHSTYIYIYTYNYNSLKLIVWFWSMHLIQALFLHNCTMFCLPLSLHPRNHAMIPIWNVQCCVYYIYVYIYIYISLEKTSDLRCWTRTSTKLNFHNIYTYILWCFVQNMRNLKLYIYI